jgi:hypothetical protein
MRAAIDFASSVLRLMDGEGWNPANDQYWELKTAVYLGRLKYHWVKAQ